MSSETWIIAGVGLNVDKIVKYINKEKLAKQLAYLIPENEKLIKIAISGDYESIDLDDLLFDLPYDNLAELLTHCDCTDVMTYSDDGRGSSYFYYSPTMPWQRTDFEPASLDELHSRIICAIQSITDLSWEEIDGIIDDDLYVPCCG